MTFQAQQKREKATFQLLQEVSGRVPARIAHKTRRFPALRLRISSKT